MDPELKTLLLDQVRAYFAAGEAEQAIALAWEVDAMSRANRSEPEAAPAPAPARYKPDPMASRAGPLPIPNVAEQQLLGNSRPCPPSPLPLHMPRPTMSRVARRMAMAGHALG